MQQRAAEYDKPEGERSMEATVTAFNAITGRNLSEADGWLLLQLLKDVRQWQRPTFHRDSAEDCVAYAALKAEALARGEVVTELNVGGHIEPEQTFAKPHVHFGASGGGKRIDPFEVVSMDAAGGRNQNGCLDCAPRCSGCTPK